jgi:Ion channel
VGAKDKFRDAAVDKFGLVLGASVMTYILVIAFDTAQFNGLAGALPVLLTVVLTLNASKPTPQARGLAIGLATIAIVLGSMSAAIHNEIIFGVGMIFAGLSLGVCIVLILRRMIEHPRVSIETVLAVLAGYVMFGLFFTFIDSGIGHIMGSFFAQPGPHSQSDYAYLSYITLTTVGFGDLTPGTGVARSVIILEALVGQIFLVTLVARMVSLLGTERVPIMLKEPPIEERLEDEE